MKRAVILHGTDGNPDKHWFPWLEQMLEEHGYKVWVPELPQNHTPNRHTYNDYVLKSGWDFTDNIVVGHSSGAVSILNLLMDERCPHIRLGLMAGAWSHMEETDLDYAQFKDLFPPEGFNFELIKSKADKLEFIHGEDDPLCPLDQAKWLAGQLGAPITVVPQAGHFLGTEYSDMWNIIETNL